jgi:hypothetical protein
MGPCKEQLVFARKRIQPVRIWFGCTFHAWIRLLARNRFAFQWPFRYVIALVTVVSLFQSLLRYVEEVLYRRRVARTTMPEQPLFIIGHWRTGTTFLHELLILDQRHTYPTTYECFAPNHFLLTEDFLPRWLGFLMPSRRPMDNMRAGWDRPQEDEFALCLMGQPSPYLTLAFPNRARQYPEYLDLEELSPQALDAWKKAFTGYLRRLTFKKPGRLVLKSPPHTCRIKVLLELFPDARFVHIVRNPYVVFPSTLTLWKTLYRTQGLQRPTFAGLEEQVFDTFNRIYEGLEEGRKLVAPRRFHELRYEDLVRDPVGQLRGLYEHLELGGFERVLPRVEGYLAQIAGYQTNRYTLSLELREAITERCGKVIRQYGYSAIEVSDQGRQVPKD